MVSPRLLPLAFASLFLMAHAVAAAEPAPGETTGSTDTLPDVEEPQEISLFGKPIRRIDVDVEGDRWKSAPALTKVKTGEPLTRETARRAMRELMDTGHFARATAEAQPFADGAAL